MAVGEHDYYHVLWWADEEDLYGTGYANLDDLFFLPYFGEVENWEPLDLELRDGDFADYLASDLCCPVCSEDLKNLLASCASSSDKLQWLPVTVTRGYDERRYYILHFPDPPDVLDKEKTRFVEGTDAVVNVVLSRAAVKNLKVFTFPKAEITWFVSGDVKKKIELAGITGMHFIAADVS